MKLDIDETPKLFNLEFVTLERTYSVTTSPRSVISKSGLEFDHFRPYTMEDDARKIDWVASARSLDTLVRVYREDTSMNILILLDVSSTMIYGTGKKAKIEQAIEIAYNLAYGILTYGDAVGLMIFNDKIISMLECDIDMKHFAEIKDALLNTANFGGGYDLDNALINAVALYSDIHLVIVISDFITKKGTVMDSISKVADRFDILGIMVTDKSDLKIEYPTNLMEMKSPYEKDIELINAKKMAEAYEEEAKRRVNEMKSFFTVIKKDLWHISTEDDIERVITNKLAERNELALAK